MDQKCEKFITSGRVQGVGFRYHTAHEGLKLGLSGYAKNLDDGTVEVIACGASDRIEVLYEWLQKGPKTAHVVNVERFAMEFEAYRGFKIL